MNEDHQNLNDEEMEVMEAFKIFDKNGDQKISGNI